MEHSIAQTNVQLFAQMMVLGHDDASLGLANRASMFAARLTSGVLRGSGKPFVCHLVGTASVVAGAGADATCIAASLLHAVYQNRVPFPGDRGLEGRREYVREHFGDGVESLIHDYHCFESVRLEECGDGELLRKRTVLMMRLADEIDDIVDLGVAMHGKPGDDASVAGSAASRRAQKAGLAPELLRAARAVGAPSIEKLLVHWLDRTATASWPEGLRSGEYSSFPATIPED